MGKLNQTFSNMLGGMEVKTRFHARSEVGFGTPTRIDTSRLVPNAERDELTTITHAKSDNQDRLAMSHCIFFAEIWPYDIGAQAACFILIQTMLSFFKYASMLP
jgi:hypothetical protein